MAEPIFKSVPTAGGGHQTVRVKVPKAKPPAPTPVTIVRKKPGVAQQVTRLGTPSAFVLLLGLGLVYYALHGFDKKYGTFNGAFAGKGNVPSSLTATAPGASTKAPAPATSPTPVTTVA